MSAAKRKNKNNVGSIRQSNVKNALKKKKEKCTPKEMKFVFYMRVATKEQLCEEATK